MKGPRRNTSGAPRALDATRARRATQQEAGGIVAGRGVTVDSTGRLETKLPDGFYFDDRGTPQMELGPGLSLVGGSRRRFVFEPTVETSRTVLVLAAPTTDDVKDTSGDTVTALLLREQTARVAADAALSARVTTLEGGGGGGGSGNGYFPSGW